MSRLWEKIKREREGGREGGREREREGERDREREREGERYTTVVWRLIDTTHMPHKVYLPLYINFTCIIYTSPKGKFTGSQGSQL